MSEPIEVPEVLSKRQRRKLEEAERRSLARERRRKEREAKRARRSAKRSESQAAIARLSQDHHARKGRRNAIAALRRAVMDKRTEFFWRSVEDGVCHGEDCDATDAPRFDARVDNGEGRIEVIQPRCIRCVLVAEGEARDV